MNSYQLNPKNKILFSSLFIIIFFVAVSSALTVYPVKIMVQQNETVQFNPLFKALDTADRAIQLSVTTQAKHGTVTVVPGAFTKGSVTVPGFQYVPNAGFLGVDSMQWSIGNTLGSATGTCRMIVHPPEPNGMLVLIYVNSALFPGVTNEINRLKDDLTAEGYTAKIKLWPNSGNLLQNAEAFHDSIKAEFDLANGLMAGTIAVGNLPFWYENCGGGNYADNDAKYWNISDWSLATDTLVWGNRGRSSRHVWFCRFYGLLNERGYNKSFYGPENLIIKRALQANHDYRTGAQRLPYTVWRYGARAEDTSSITDQIMKIWSRPGVKMCQYDPSCNMNLLPYTDGGEAAIVSQGNRIKI